jgi:hypothetical protein
MLGHGPQCCAESGRISYPYPGSAVEKHLRYGGHKFGMGTGQGRGCSADQIRLKQNSMTSIRRGKTETTSHIFDDLPDGSTLILSATCQVNRNFSCGHGVFKQHWQPGDGQLIRKKPIRLTLNRLFQEKGEKRLCMRYCIMRANNDFYIFYRFYRMLTIRTEKLSWN